VSYMVERIVQRGIEVNKDRASIPAGQSCTNLYLFLLIAVTGILSNELKVSSCFSLEEVGR
jgi:hypothetical protein